MVATVALSAVLVGTLSGCGTTKAGNATTVNATADPSGGVPVGAAAQLQKAGDATSAAKSARVHETIMQNGDTRVVDGEFSWDGGAQSVMHTQLPAAEMAKLQSDGTADLIATHTAMYVNLHVGPRVLQALGGDHWMEYDNSDLKQLGSASAAYVDMMASASPVAEIHAMITSGKLTNPRPETVDGVQTTHYSAELTPDGLTGYGQSGDALAAEREVLHAQGVKTLSIDVWVDSHGLIVQRYVRKELGSGVTSEAQVSYSDYGVQFQATPPPAADTINVGKKMVDAGKNKQPGLDLS
jgi:hypothetical protein